MKKVIFLVLILLSFHTSKSQNMDEFKLKNNEYINVNIGDLKSFLEKNRPGVLPDTVLPSNYCSVYKINDSLFMFLPMAGSVSSTIKKENEYPGFVFKSMSTLNTFIDKDFFPINDSFKTIDEIEYAKLSEIDKNIDYYRIELNKMLKTDFRHNIVISDLETAYEKIKKIKRIKKNINQLEKIIYYYTILILNYFQTSFDGNWVLVKKYAPYNPYYKPYVKIGDKLIDAIGIVYGSFPFDEDFVTFFDFINRARIPFSAYRTARCL